MSASLRLNLLEQGRGTEWLTSVVLLAFATTLMMPGDSLAAASFKAFRDAGMDEAMISVPLATLGSFRLGALYINGNWKRSPMVRMIGAILGGSVFFMLAVAFAWPMLDRYNRDTTAEIIGASTGIGTYLVLAFFDALSAYRSGADVRVVRQSDR